MKLVATTIPSNKTLHTPFQLQCNPPVMTVTGEQTRRFIKRTPQTQPTLGTAWQKRRWQKQCKQLALPLPVNPLPSPSADSNPGLMHRAHNPSLNQDLKILGQPLKRTASAVPAPPIHPHTQQPIQEHLFPQSLESFGQQRIFHLLSSLRQSVLAC